MTEQEKKELQEKFKDSKIKLSFEKYKEANLTTEQDEYLSESQIFELARELIKSSNVTQQQVVDLLKSNGHHKVTRQAISKMLSNNKSMLRLALAVITHLYPNNIEFAEEKYFLLIGPKSPRHSMNEHLKK